MLEELRRFNLTWDVWAVATIQEEETLLGARTSAFDLHPDIAVAIDVTFGKGPGSNDHHTFPLGKGRQPSGWEPIFTLHLQFDSKKMQKRWIFPTL